MSATENKTDKAEAEVQKVVDQETSQGYRGVEVDTTPNENYTVAGVIAGKPVPEASADPNTARRQAAK